MASYSGNLIRSWSSAEESANFAPDPAHGQRDTPQEYPTTDQVYPETGMEYEGTQMPVDMAVGQGLVLGTPSRSHQGIGGRRMVRTDDQHREELRVLHSEDGQRASLASAYTRPPMQDSHTVYSDTYAESPDIYATPNNSGAVAVMRGIDGNPQNNPEGIRRGWERGGPYVERDRRLGRRRYHYGMQPLVERTVYVPASQPQIRGAGPDILPLPTWKQAGTLTGIKRPALFRAPPAVDESWLATEQGTATAGIGGGLAG